MKFLYKRHSYKFTSFVTVFCFAALISISLLGIVKGQNAPSQNQGQSQPPNAKPKPSPSPSPARGPSELQKALNEFRIQMGQVGAGGGPRKFKVASRQNSLTGRLYENFRNDFLDAVPHEVRQRGAAKSLLRRNQYGFNVSGPVVAPWL